jgi:hypothetical protein
MTVLYVAGEIESSKRSSEVGEAAAEDDLPARYAFCRQASEQ